MEISGNGIGMIAGLLSLSAYLLYIIRTFLLIGGGGELVVMVDIQVAGGGVGGESFS